MDSPPQEERPSKMKQDDQWEEQGWDKWNAKNETKGRIRFRMRKQRRFDERRGPNMDGKREHAKSRK